jgi:transcriptional regulator with XRE-family HTH domain
MLPNGQKIRSLRTERGWTQLDLAQLSGTTARTIQRMESGEGVSADTLKAVASAFNIDFRDLIASENKAEHSPDMLAEADKLVKKRLEIRRQADELRSKLSNYWESIVHGCILAEGDRRKLDKWLGTFSTVEIMNAMDACEREYVHYQPQGLCTPSTAEYAFNKIPAVCRVNRRAEANPDERQLYFIRGVVRNRIEDFDNTEGIRLLRQAYTAGVDVERLREFAGSVQSWQEFERGLMLWADDPTLESLPEKL